MTSMNLSLAVRRLLSSSVLATLWVADELVVRADATNKGGRGLDGDSSSVSKKSPPPSFARPDLADEADLSSFAG